MKLCDNCKTETVIVYDSRNRVVIVDADSLDDSEYEYLPYGKVEYDPERHKKHECEE